MRALLVLLAIGCNGNDDKDVVAQTTDSGATDVTDVTGVPTPTGDPATVPLGGRCPMDERWGGFVVETYDFYAIVDGSVTDGVVPVSVLSELDVIGDCRMLQRLNPYCEGGCPPTDTCDFDGTCVPFPVGQDLGTATIGGLVQDVIMEPVMPGYSYFDTTLPRDAWVPGDLIELRTHGIFGDQELHGVGVERLSIPDEPILLQHDTPLTVHWTAPSGEVRSRVEVRLEIDQHGLTPASLVCDFEDDGEGTIDGSLVDSLIARGVTGFPNGTVRRVTVDRADLGDGCMDLAVSSPVTPQVRVEGFTPCYGPQDCPEGQTCNTAIQICE